jgi:gliding motility-associated-like protein
LSDTGIFNIPVMYTSADIDHCSHSEKTSIAVLVKAGPVADYTYNYHGCITDTAFFTGLADVNNYNLPNYNWRYDDNTVDSVIASSKQFTKGDHPVYLQVIADNGCMDDTTRMVTTYPKPLAKFGYTHNVCMGNDVLFSDSSTIERGNITSWRWDFADGNNLVAANNNPFNHNYTLADTFSVSLVAISDIGCISDTSFEKVQVNKKPQVNFNFIGKPCIDSSFIFTPVVALNGNAIQSSFWSFGDGQTQTTNSTNAINHGYATAINDVLVKYVVSGGIGCLSDTAMQTIPVIHPAPDADFTISGNSFCPQQNVAFTYVGAATIQLWSWDFGNGKSTASSPVNRTYASGGIYPVSLTIQTTDGCGSTPFTKPVNIYNPPNIDAGPVILKLPGQTVTINASLTDTGTYQYQWSPGLFLSDAAILKPVTNTPTNMLYSIKVSGGPGNCEATDTVSVIVLKDLFIPSAFSPNNDGTNDRWNIASINNNPDALVIIYNRWGQKIFESKGYGQPWDGTYMGVAQPAGAYYYQVQPDVKKPKVVSGSVMIVR